MSNLLERALQTLWQALLGAGVTIPAFTDADGWLTVVLVVSTSLIAAVASAVKTWLQERVPK